MEFFPPEVLEHNKCIERLCDKDTRKTNFVHPLRLGLGSLLGSLLLALGGCRRLRNRLLLGRLLIRLLALLGLGGIFVGGGGLNSLWLLSRCLGSLNSLGLLHRDIVYALELRQIDLVTESLELVGLCLALPLLLVNALGPLLTALALIQSLLLNAIPRSPLESSVGSLPDIGVELLRRNILALQDMAVHQIVVHSLGDNLSNSDGGEFHECIVLGPAGETVARETKTGNLAELGEVGAHLVLVETVGDASGK